jgi:hypothetical protein
MPTLIAQPARIQSAGNKPKRIDEYIGRVNSQTSPPDGSSRARLPLSTNSPSFSMAHFTWNTKLARSTSRPDRPSSPTQASGSVTPLPRKAAPTTSPSAFPPSRWRPSTAINREMLVPESDWVRLRLGWPRTQSLSFFLGCRLRLQRLRIVVTHL